MAKEYTFLSPLSSHIQGLIEEKHSCGFKYISQPSILKKFDDYWRENHYEGTLLTIENLDGWVQQRKNECAGTLRNRVNVVRELAKYQNGLGIASYIPIVEARYEVPVRHIMTKPELKAFFQQVDSYKPLHLSHDGFTRMADEYPVLFRLIYHCGFRIEEICSLPLSQIDLGSGIITIIDGKGGKDRLVYLSDDIKDLCKDYYSFLTGLLNKKPVWLFPGVNPDNHISVPTVSAMFRACWSKTSFAATSNKNPTVHDLRHGFVTDRINLWAEQGISFDEMLPFLSRHLGHISFKETFYYYHFAKEAALLIMDKDKVSAKVIPEVRRR